MFITVPNMWRKFCNYVTNICIPPLNLRNKMSLIELKIHLCPSSYVLYIFNYFNTWNLFWSWSEDPIQCFFPKMDNKYFQNNYINHLSILHLFEDYYFNILNAYICFHLFGGFYSLYWIMSILLSVTCCFHYNSFIVCFIAGSTNSP